MSQGRRYRVTVCRGPECGERRGSAAIHAELVRRIPELGLGGQCDLGWQSCFGHCRSGPNVLVQPAPPPGTLPSLFATMPTRGPGTALYNHLTPGDVIRILQSHVGQGIIVRELISRPVIGEPSGEKK